MLWKYIYWHENSLIKYYLSEKSKKYMYKCICVVIIGWRDYEYFYSHAWLLHFLHFLQQGILMYIWLMKVKKGSVV